MRNGDTQFLDFHDLTLSAYSIIFRFFLCSGVKSQKKMKKTEVFEVIGRDRPLIIAHRGASALAPENTMAAFRQGICDGADGVEFDVRLTKDGVPIVFHDVTLKRVGGLESRISDVDLGDLAGIDVGSWFLRAKQEFSDTDWKSERIPTLATVLELFRKQTGPVYIELKCDRPADAPSLVEAVSDVIRSSNISRSRIIVKSFELAALPHVRRLLPDVAAAALFGPKFVRLVRSRSSIVERALLFGATHLSLHRSLISMRLMKKAREAGMPVTAWTIDSPTWLARNVHFGLYAVITNDPARLLASGK